MSEPELAYMTNNSNDDFDLPRWQTQAHLEPLSSSAQAAQSARASFLYPGAPPSSLSTTTTTTTTSSLHHSPGSRQPRVPLHPLDQDHQPSAPTTSYLSGALNQLSRSASLGGSTSITGTARARRHHQPDDLEGAFNVDASRSIPATHQPSSVYSLYPSSTALHQPHSLHSASTPRSDASPAATAPPEPYSDMYYNSSAANVAKRTHTQLDPTARSGRSPLRPGNALLDPYQQQPQYSPSTTPTYLYGSSPSEPQRGSSSSAYQTHSRNPSQLKDETSTPPLSVQGAYTAYTVKSSSPQPPAHQNQTHLSAAQLSIKSSTSTPNTPLPFAHSQSPVNHFYQDSTMVVDAPQHRRRASGFRRVRDSRDLRPYVNNQPTARRVDANGIVLSPLRQLTTHIVETYHICNPQFRYESAHNPRRVLTKPSKPVHNDGYDNEDYDYILYVNDWLGNEDGHNRYLILDILGQGTFGQVVKCQNMKTNEIVAVKVVKNKPAYFNQSMMEVTILELLNNQCDPQDEHHILRLLDSFIHRNHLCLVFELLSSNLYELIKQNQFQGLSTQLVKVFTAQLLDAMTVLKEARLIHCDLKPENILLKSLQSPQIKVIDFGSACHERQTVYTYIQSRFYRSPEVILGIPYTSSIDMWSLGCIAVELFLGLPLFPGTSEYNQMTRIVEMLGMAPPYMLDMGKQTKQFFDSFVDAYGQKKYRLKSLEQYSREHNTNEQPGKQYFKATTLPEIINSAPMPNFKSRQGHEMEKELNHRASFIDFCQGLLNLNPIERWSPQQARMHPFITGEKFTKSWSPNGHMSAVNSVTGTDPKRPYGGLVPSQPKGARAFQDAASYNQQLAQHQAFKAQTQAANNIYRNPYIAAQHDTSQGASSSQTAYGGPEGAGSGSYGPPPPAPPQSQHHQCSASQPSNTQSVFVREGLVPTMLHPGALPSSYFSGGAHGRGRANTINHDAIPPALARLQHMNQDVLAGGRNALTPVLNRDDAMREWERRQTGKPPAPAPYPQLEYLQQQAELAAASGGWHGGGGGGGGGGGARYGAAQPSKLSQSYQPHQPHQPTIVVDDESGREAVLSDVRTGGVSGPSSTYNPAAMVTSPTQSSGGVVRYPAYASQPPNPTFNGLGARPEIGALYAPIQPDQYQPYGNASRQLYGAVVASAVPNAAATQQPVQRNPFSNTTEGGAAPQGQASTKESRRLSGMDIWSR